MPRSARHMTIALVLSSMLYGTFTLFGIAPAGAASTVMLGANLILNPGADAGPGSPDDGHIVKPPHWSTTGCLTAVMYGASGGFPDATSTGPKDRGKNMFQGGPRCPLSTGSQVIPVSSLSSLVDAGRAGYTLSGYLGGFAGQADDAMVSLDFLSASGGSLGKAVIGPVTHADRADTTGLVARSKTGVVPRGTRSVRVTITATRSDGSYNDGSADSLSFVIAKK